MQVATKATDKYVCIYASSVRTCGDSCMQPALHGYTLSNSTTQSDQSETSKWLFPDSNSVNSF